jgi:hypothetical protein
LLQFVQERNDIFRILNKDVNIYSNNKMVASQEMCVELSIDPIKISNNLYKSIINHMYQHPEGVTYTSLKLFINEPQHEVSTTERFFVCIWQRGVSGYLNTFLIQKLNLFFLPDNFDINTFVPTPSNIIIAIKEIISKLNTRTEGITIIDINHALNRKTKKSILETIDNNNNTTVNSRISKEELIYEICKFISSSSKKTRTFDEIIDFIKLPKFCLQTNKDVFMHLNPNGLPSFIRKEMRNILIPLDNSNYTLKCYVQLLSNHNIYSTDNMNDYLNRDSILNNNEIKNIGLHLNSSVNYNAISNHSNSSNIDKNDYSKETTPLYSRFSSLSTSSEVINDVVNKTILPTPPIIHEDNQKLIYPSPIGLLPPPPNSSSLSLGTKINNLSPLNKDINFSIENSIDQLTSSSVSNNTASLSPTSLSLAFLTANKTTNSESNTSTINNTNNISTLFYNENTTKSDPSCPSVLTPRFISPRDIMLSPRDQLISNWLPQVFYGYEEQQVVAFVKSLQMEGGFVTVQDLVDAQTNNQLTSDFLSALNFKIGHCNRLFSGLKNSIL